MLPKSLSRLKTTTAMATAAAVARMRRAPELDFFGALTEAVGRTEVMA
jgi:hypothetical protein